MQLGFTWHDTHTAHVHTIWPYSHQASPTDLYHGISVCEQRLKHKGNQLSRCIQVNLCLEIHFSSLFLKQSFVACYIFKTTTMMHSQIWNKNKREWGEVSLLQADISHIKALHIPLEGLKAEKCWHHVACCGTAAPLSSLLVLTARQQLLIMNESQLLTACLIFSCSNNLRGNVWR